jgi:hypothetical protein
MNTIVMFYYHKIHNIETFHSHKSASEKIMTYRSITTVPFI